MATNEVDDIDTSSILCEELEVLESIYIHELNVERDESGRPTLISLDLHPATGDDLEKRYVTMTLNIYPSHEYPDEPPGIEIKNPRGIAEQEIQRVLNNMHGQAEERKGGPMLYELTEIAKECLTEGNIPHGPCPICLKLFTEGDPFMRTDCYHHFHLYCLAKHIHVSLTKDEELEESAPPGVPVGKEDKEDEVVCPVCRFPIDYYDLDLLDQAPDPQHADDNNDNTVTMLRWQQHLSNMAEIYARQKANGGIIDLEEEKNKYLVPENFVISLKPAEEELPVKTVIIPASNPRDIDNKNRGHNHRKNFRSSRNYGHKYDRSHRSHDQNHFQGHRFSQGHHRERKPRSDRAEENFQNRRGYSGQADSRHKRYVDSGNNERHYSDSSRTHSNPKKVSDKAKHNSDKFEDCDKNRSCSSSEEMKGLTDDLTSKCDLNISKTGERSGSSNQSTKASSHTANSTRGNSANGNSGSANSTRGNSGSANSTRGNSTRGNSESANSTRGNSASGNSGSVNSTSANGKRGNSASNNIGSDNSACGNTARINRASANSASGNSSSGNSGSANSCSDYSSRGNRASDNSSSGNSASNNRVNDNSACGNTARSNRASAHSASGNTSSACSDSVSSNSASANSISDNSASAICVNGEISESETFNSPSESKSSMKNNASVNTCTSSDEVPDKSSHAQGHHKQMYKSRFYQAKPSSRYKTEPKSSQNPNDKFLQGDSCETVKDFGGSSRRGRGRAHRKFFQDRDPCERNENSPTSISENKPRPQSRGRGRGYRGQRNHDSEHSDNYYDSRDLYNKRTNYTNPARQNVEMVPGDIATEHRLNPNSSRPHEVSLQAGKTSLKNTNSDYTKRINCEKSTDFNGLCQKPSKPPPGFSQEIVSAKSRVKSYVKPPPGFDQVS